MSPNRSTSACLLLALTCSLAAQSSPAWLEIAAPRNWLLSAGTLQLQARAYGPFGESLSSVTPLWRTSNPAVAMVDESGLIRGLMLGRAEIEAAAGDTAAQFTVWVQPARILIEPARVELEAGQSAPATARALDAAGRAIAGIAFRWTTGHTSVAAVDSSGLVRGVAAGTTSLQASIESPGAGPAYSAQAAILVRPRPDFRIEAFPSVGLDVSPVRLLRMDRVRPAGSRHVLLSVLSDGSAAVLVYDGGQFRSVVASGDVAAGALVQSIQNLATNERGDILVLLQLNQWPWQILARYPASGAPETIPQPDGHCCLGLSSEAIGADGRFVFTGRDNARAQLFLRHTDGRIERIDTSRLPGFGIPDGMSASLHGSGQVILAASNNSEQALFQYDGREFRRLLARGDTLLGNRVNGMGEPLVNASGDIYLHVWGINFSMIARYSGGAWSSVMQGGLLSGIQIHGPNQLHSVRGQEILFSANTDQGTGLFRLHAAGLETVAWHRDTPGIRDALLAADGSTLLLAAGQGVASRLSRLSSSGTSTVVDAGQTVKSSGRYQFDIRNLGNAGDANTRLLRTPGGLLLRADRNSISVILPPGGVLPGGGLVDSIGDMATSSNGNAVITVHTTLGSRLYVFSGGQLRQFAEGEIRGRVALNNRGQVAALAHHNNQDALLLYQESGGAPRVVMTPSPVLFWPNEVAIDETGRVAYVAGSPTGNGIYLWDNGVTRKIAEIGEAGPGGRRLNWFRYLQASGNRFYVSLQYDGFEQFSVYDGPRWQPVLSHGDRLSFGGTVHWFHFGGQFKVSATGDIAFLADLRDGGPTALLRRTDGRDLVAIRSGQRIFNGQWLGDVQDVSFADGAVFFSSMNLSTGEMTLFRATPQ